MWKHLKNQKTSQTKIYEKQNQEQLRAKENLIAQTKLEKQKQINLVFRSYYRVVVVSE